MGWAEDNHHGLKVKHGIAKIGTVSVLSDGFRCHYLVFILGSKCQYFSFGVQTSLWVTNNSSSYLNYFFHFDMIV